MRGHGDVKPELEEPVRPVFHRQTAGPLYLRR